MAFRWLILLLLVSAGVLFALFAITGQQRFKHYGLRILKWTLFAAFFFFAVLIAERIA
jgi:hypothetical protein